MALITTNASLIRQYTPFTGLSATERSQSGIARAELVYYGGVDWNGPGAGNDRLIQVPQTTLPEDFGYVLTDVFVSVKDDVGAYVAAEGVGQMRLFPGGILGPMINLTLRSNDSKMGINPTTPIGDVPSNQFNTLFPSIYGSRGVVNYTLDKNFTGLIYPYGGKAYSDDPKSTFDLALGEQLQNGLDYIVYFYIRFLQYDIDQSYNYVIQSPQLTR